MIGALLLALIYILPIEIIDRVEPIRFPIVTATERCGAVNPEHVVVGDVSKEVKRVSYITHRLSHRTVQKLCCSRLNFIFFRLPSLKCAQRNKKIVNQIHWWRQHANRHVLNFGEPAGKHALVASPIYYLKFDASLLPHGLVGYSYIPNDELWGVSSRVSVSRQLRVNFHLVERALHRDGLATDAQVSEEGGNDQGRSETDQPPIGRRFALALVAGLVSFYLYFWGKNEIRRGHWLRGRCVIIAADSGFFIALVLVWLSSFRSTWDWWL